MTPVEKAGYKIGQRFDSGSALTFSAGSIIELELDDGTDCPLFKLISGECHHRCSKSNGHGAYAPLNKIKPLEETKMENKTYVAFITHREGGSNLYKNIIDWDFEKDFIALHKKDGGAVMIPNDAFSSIDIDLEE